MNIVIKKRELSRARGLTKEPAFPKLFARARGEKSVRANLIFFRSRPRFFPRGSARGRELTDGRCNKLQHNTGLAAELIDNGADSIINQAPVYCASLPLTVQPCLLYAHTYTYMYMRGRGYICTCTHYVCEGGGGSQSR